MPVASEMRGQCRLILTRYRGHRQLVPARQVLRADDEPHAVLLANVCVCPLTEHCEAIAEADDKEDVHGEPNEPGNKTRPVRVKRPCDARDGSLPAYRRHVALVEVVEGLLFGCGCRILYEKTDAVCCVHAHLHGGLCRARDLPPVLFNVREIADDKYLRMIRWVEMFIHLHATAAIEAMRHAERLCK